jgi:hypothetical protein
VKTLALIAAIAAAVLLAGCETGLSEAELIRAANAACPAGLKSMDFSGDNTGRVDHVECEPSQAGKGGEKR